MPLNVNAVITSGKPWMMEVRSALNAMKKGEKMLSKFGGRKFISAVALALFIGLNNALNLGMESESLNQMSMIVGAWILGESVIDAASANGRSKKS